MRKLLKNGCCKGLRYHNNNVNTGYAQIDLLHRTDRGTNDGQNDGRLTDGL